MILTNCNEIINVPCNCTVSFVPAATSVNGLLDVGNLIGTGCTSPITNYVIDWYVNGIIVLTTGSDISYSSDITHIHPFTGAGNAIPAPSFGTYYPVVRKFKMAGEDIYGTPIRCRNYCQLNNLPPVVVQKTECGMIGGSPDAGYSFKVYYKPTLPPISRINAFPFYITPAYKYVAIKIDAGAARYDSFYLYYDDGITRTALPHYSVGTNTSTSEANKSLGQRYMYLVVDYATGRTVKLGDYIFVQVESGSDADTEWTFQIVCLTEDDFNIAPNYEFSQCTYLSRNLRVFKLSTGFTPSVTYSSTTCNYTFKFYMNEMRSVDFINSNLIKYTNIQQWTSHTSPTLAINTTAGEIKCNLFRGISTGVSGHWGSYYYSPSYSKYMRYFQPKTNKSEFIVYDLRDYSGFRNQFNQHIGANGIIDSYWITMGNELDKTDLWYYSNGNLRGFGTNNNYELGTTIEKVTCGDSIIGNWEDVFHVSSQFSYKNNYKTYPTAAELGSFLEDMAEIRFRALVRGVSYTSPTIISMTGDLDCVVFNKVANVNTTDILLKTIQADSIFIRGTNGELVFSFPQDPGNPTKSIIFTTQSSIKDTLKAYATTAIINEYANYGIEFSTYTHPEIRFKAINVNYDYGTPVVTRSAGSDITWEIIPRSTVSTLRRRSDSIVFTGGTNGIIYITIGTTTTSFEVGGDNVLQNAVLIYASTSGTVSANILAYKGIGVELTAYSGFIGTLEVVHYDGVRDAYNLEFNKDYIVTDPDLCNARPATVLSQTELMMNNTSSRTLTVRDTYPSIGAYGVDGWSRGEIIKGKTSNATCEIVSWKGVNQYDIKYTTSGTFVVGEQLQNELKNKAAYFVSISNPMNPIQLYSSCVYNILPNGSSLYMDYINQIYADFYYGYRYPLSSLNTICENSPDWITSGDADIFFIFYITLNFDKTYLETGQNETDKVIRMQNFEIYTRLKEDEFGNTTITSRLGLNVTPSESWSPGDVVKTITAGIGSSAYGTYCTIISKINDYLYEVSGVSGVFTDGALLGVYVNNAWTKTAQQTLGAPRIVGLPVYKLGTNNGLWYSEQEWGR